MRPKDLLYTADSEISQNVRIKWLVTGIAIAIVSASTINVVIRRRKRRLNYQDKEAM